MHSEEAESWENQKYTGSMTEKKVELINWLHAWAAGQQSPGAGMVLKFLQPLRVWISFTERWQGDDIPWNFCNAKINNYGQSILLPHPPGPPDCPNSPRNLSALPPSLGMCISLPNRKCSSNFPWEETFMQIVISEQLMASLNLIGAHSLERISGFSFPQFLGSILWCFFNLMHHVVETNLPASSKWDPPKFKYS